MLKINKDMSVELDEDITPEDIVNLMVSFNNGQFTTNIASVLQTKDKTFIKKLEAVFLDVLLNRFDEEYRRIFIGTNGAFFSQLGIGRTSPQPAISPLAAFKKP